MPFFGKSGADAVFKALHHICKVIARYEVKLGEAIDAALADGVIDAGQAATAHTFVSAANGFCTIFELVASVSGF